MAVDALAVITAGISSSATLLVINMIGVTAAWKGYMPPRFLRKLSKLLTTFVLPALTFSKLASSLSVELLGQAWTVALWAVISVSVGLLLGLALRYLLQLDKVVGPGLARVFVIACGFNNSTSLPLVLVEALCQMSPLDLQTDCFDRGAAATFIYIVPHKIMFWGFAATLLVDKYLDADDEEQQDAAAATTVNAVAMATPVDLEQCQQQQQQQQQQRQQQRQQHSMVMHASTVTSPSMTVTPARKPPMSFWSRVLHKALLTPIFFSVILGIVVGLIAPIQSALFTADGSLQWLAASLRIVGVAAVSMSALIMAASIGHSMKRVWTAGASCCSRTSSSKVHAGSAEPAAAVATSSNGDDDSVVKPRKADAPAWVTATLVVSRMLVVAAVNVALAVFGMAKLLPAGSDPMLLLLMVIEGATPPANALIIVCQANGFRRGAEFLAMSYIFCYAVGIVTLAATSSIAFAAAVQ